ncbi:MAG: DEAD/DEAH box helicase [Bacteroidia bacterium]|nr:DEAD/DEAH box helicase [Bacteroidia bacterium]
MDAIDSLGYEFPTPIQAKAIPVALAGRDIIGCAQTGTGKTAAYLIPTLDWLSDGTAEYPRVLILAPTRELAEQIDQNIEGLGYYAGISSIAIYGGKASENWDRQKMALTTGADIIVATPGRLMTHMALGYVKFDQIRTVILDEADKMLDMGFYPDIMTIIKETPTERQTLMFSATMPPKIRKLAQEILRDPVEINLNIAKPAAGITQLAYMIDDDRKIPLLEHILRTREVDSMIIFASSKLSVDRIHAKLQKLNYNVRAMHSDKEQDERQETLRQFKNKQFPILVGTDVLSRGIDIDNLSHVVNYDVPLDAEDYVHRVGRTARANTTGEAHTLVNYKDLQRFARIEKLIESQIPRGEIPDSLGPPPDFGSGGEVRERRDGRGGRDGRGSSGSRDGRPRGGKGSSSSRPKGPRSDAQPRPPRPEPQAPAPPAAAGPDGTPAAKRRRRGGKRRKRPNAAGGSPQPQSAPAGE